MTDDADRASRLNAAAEAIHDFLQRSADSIGPVGEDMEGAPETAFIEQWVVVAAWTDGEGSTWLTRFGPPSQPAYQRDGLLHQALYKFD